jgi:gliding motility-associated-like protein
MKKQFFSSVALLFISQFIYAQFTVNFSANPLTACVGQTINFTDLSSSGVSSWVWDFGDGNSSTLQNPTHSYSAAGSYTVTLVASNGLVSLTEVKTNYILINPLPQPSFTLSNPPCTVPASVNVVSVQPSSGVTYSWNFGNGQTSTSQTPTGINYTSEGSYTVSLTVTNTTTGCTNSTSQVVNIFNYTTDFSFSPQTICVGSSVNFSSTSSPGTNAYNWNFGNGQTSTLQNPTAIYSAPGTYTVSLTSFNTTNGCSGTASQTVTVISGQTPSMTPSITVGCNPSTIEFTNTSDFEGTFSWNFGNGNTFNGENPPPQTYSISPTATSETFNVFLFSTDANGCSSVQSYPNLITIFNLVAAFTANQVDGCEILPVDFTNNSSSPVSSAPITSWLWDFGNGETSTLQNPPTQNYPEGIYTVSLTVATADGCTQSVEIDEYIQVGVPPTALFTFGPDTICARQNLTFVNQSWVFDPDNNEDLTFEWYIGSQGPFSDFEPNDVPITDTGALDITLIVFFRGCPDTLIMEEAVFVWAPVVEFSLPAVICNPELPVEVTISESSTLGREGDIVEVEWNFGDGTILNFDSPTAWQNNNQDLVHTYSAFGQYTVQQKITNLTNGCVDSIPQTININSFLVTLNLDNDSNCVNSPTNFSWDYVSIEDFPPVFYFYAANQTTIIGNSDLGNVSNPFSYVFNQAGLQQITVGAVNSLGCESSATQNVVVLARPNALIQSVEVVGCIPSTIVFESGSTSVSGVPISNLSWSFNNTTPTIGNGNTTFNANISSAGTYNYGLTVTDEFGCSSSVSQSITVTEPIANFSMPPVICNNSNLEVINLSSNFVSSAWYWNGNLVSNDNNPVINIGYPNDANTSSYNDEIQLIVTDDNGCTSVLTLPLLVSSPQANFSFNFLGANQDENGNFTCPPVFAVFTDESDAVGNISSWNWVFGDGKSSTLQNPNNTYVFAGTYTASLTIVDEYGCESAITLEDFLTIQGPTGEFAWQPIGTLCDLNYEFEVISLNGVSQIQWFPGDNSSFSSLTGGSYSYPSSGVFVPSVIITDANNCAVTYTLDTITIFFGNLNAQFSVNPTELNWGVPLNVINESTGGIGGIINNNWTIGSANFNNQSPQFSYLVDDAGVVALTLIVTDSLGCIDSTSLTIIVNIAIQIPNVFTPNGDGVNDFFIFIDNPYKEYEVVILNRWGNEVSRASVVNDDYLWDGRTQSDDFATEGVYYYFVSGILRDGTPRQDHGFVHLVLE